MTQAQIAMLVLQIIRGLVQRADLERLGEMSDDELKLEVERMQAEYQAGWDAWDQSAD